MVGWSGGPVACGQAQNGEIDREKVGGEFLEFFERSGDQRLRPDSVPARIMVKRGCELNQALQERLLGLAGRQPDLFPNFVCFEKLPRIEENDSSLKIVPI